MIPVQKQSDRYFVYSKEDFYRDEAQLRAPCTESAGGGYRIDNTPTYYANVWALHKDICDMIRANADAPINMDRDTTEYLTQQMLIRKEKVWIENYFQTGVWGTDTVPTTKWDDVNGTPIEDICNAGLDIAKATGYRPNTLVISPDVFCALKNNADVLDRIKYTQRGVVTTDILANLFEVDRVLVTWGVENTANEGATGVFDFVSGTEKALLVYSNPRPSILQPTGGYTFTWTGLIGAGREGTRMKSFRMDHLESDRMEIESAFDMKLVAPDLGVLFNDVLS
jgi:hypothetical protein